MSADIRDRRQTNTGDLCQKLANMQTDLLAFTADAKVGPGIAYSVANRLGMLIDELRGQR